MVALTVKKVGGRLTVIAYGNHSMLYKQLVYQHQGN